MKRKKCDMEFLRKLLSSDEGKKQQTRRKFQSYSKSHENSTNKLKWFAISSDAFLWEFLTKYEKRMGLCCCWNIQNAIISGWSRNEKGFDLLFVNSFVRWREKWGIRRTSALKHFTKDHSLIWRSLNSVIMREIYVFVWKFEGFRVKFYEKIFSKVKMIIIWNLEINFMYFLRSIFSLQFTSDQRTNLMKNLC